MPAEEGEIGIQLAGRRWHKDWLVGMEEFFRALLSIPMLFMVLGTAALFLWRFRRTSRALLAASAVGLLLTSLPVTSKAIIMPLLSLTEIWTPAEKPVDAFLVPTSGLYFDGRNRWWASAGSVRRLAAALAARDTAAALGRGSTPVIISGGATRPEAPPEAAVLARQFNISEPWLVLETESLDSYETAVNLERQLRGQKIRRLVVFTDQTHMARMAGVLRHQGFEVFLAPAPSAGEPCLRYDRLCLIDFLPQPRGFHLSARALRELTGIFWYIVKGRLSLGDLKSE